MSTSTASTVLQRPHSSSRRSQSYVAVSPVQPNRTASVSSRSTQATPTGPQRSASQSHAHHRTSSSQYSPQPAGAAVAEVLPHRDFETSNLPEMASTRRSTSRDGPAAPAVSRTESIRSGQRSSSRSTHVRQVSDATTVAPAAMAVRGELAMTQPVRRRTTITGRSGQWALGKTIGAGSMGKVKLAKKMETGEAVRDHRLTMDEGKGANADVKDVQVAVKIVPRQSPDDGRDDRERERHDHSKEIRTQREAAIVALLDHPYICGLRDVVRTNYHWYMLFEYVDGGQMLDYIISHGRLKDKPARKFSRQIASALDYCHRNSIVHRDLKIENILISKTGDIKIIDFGLSNLFSPRSHLKTFCGSLYFAAPELLQAKPYTGPEVDVWSFGIVLYVLVCGKVPFDDQSMPQLHAKIKKGVVDYPQWLSGECKNLISRMLVTDPKQRATLHEIMTHPWMCKGFSAPVDNHLPPREPLQLPLDPTVIEAMEGFDFGPPDFITKQLTRVLESDDYQHAVRAAGRDQAGGHGAGERRRGFAAFDFYKRRSSTISGDTLANPSAETVGLAMPDPISAYSPLISIYHLVRERQRRQQLETNPGVTRMPRGPHERPLQVPDLPAPAAAHTNHSTYEMPGEAATGGRTRPRARTHGEDDVTETMKNVHRAVVPPTTTTTTTTQTPTATPPTIVTPQPEAPPPKKESTAVGLLRRLSTRRHRDPDKEAQAKPAAGGPSGSASRESGGVPLRKSFSVRRARHREAPPAPLLRTTGSQPQHQDLLSPPITANNPRPRRGPQLGRSTSVNSADMRRRSIHQQPGPPASSASYPEPPPTSGSERSSTDGRRPRATESTNPAGDHLRPDARPSATRARSLGHARRESIQARRARREEAGQEAGVPEETDQELAASGGSGDVAGPASGAEHVRPVYLKGLFSVSTTSPKPVSAIRAEIIRVLQQLGVEYVEMRGGFKCKHRPSIDLPRAGGGGGGGGDTDAPPPDRAPSSMFSPSTRRRISFGGFMGGGSSGGGGGGGERDEVRESTSRTPHTPKTPSRRQWADASPTFSEGSEMSVGRTGGGGTAAGSGGRAVGETTTQVQNELSEGNMVLSFEIVIVKVPILALHGLQFKRMAGGTWQYKKMADKILKELRL
ncbi:MAG: serine/threonine-protein kinase KIN2 [Watsoniomyces obsoletus]|nr:MAG: serine/threonine-protein kinase KIN2 [Watsoniomyces obsoletus]